MLLTGFMLLFLEFIFVTWNIRKKLIFYGFWKLRKGVDHNFASLKPCNLWCGVAESMHTSHTNNFFNFFLISIISHPSLSNLWLWFDKSSLAQLNSSSFSILFNDQQRFDQWICDGKWLIDWLIDWLATALLLLVRFLLQELPSTFYWGTHHT